MIDGSLPAVLLAQGGHGHLLTVGVSIGPTVLRVALLVAIPAVAAFAVLRGFLPEPDTRTLTVVLMIASGAVVLELLLSGGLDFAEQLVPVVLALLAVPIYLVRSRDPRFAFAVDLARRLAAWIFWPVGVYAAILFARANFAGAEADDTAKLLHSGVVLALVALAWFTVARTRRAAGAVSAQVGAWALAMVLMAGAAQVTVLRVAEPEVAASAAVASW